MPLRPRRRWPLALAVALLGAAAAAPAPDLCAAATAAECALTPPFCLQACAWNVSAEPPYCHQCDCYPQPDVSVLTALVGSDTPLSTNFLTLAFYGDGVTSLGLYEDILAEAIIGSPFTGNVRIVNQGVVGATLRDLIQGWSPSGGHLNPFAPRTNATFVETLRVDKPDYIAVQIGLEDVLHYGAACGERCSNTTEYVRLFTEHIVNPVLERNISMAVVSVATIGEHTNEGNAFDRELDVLAAAQLALAYANGFAYVDLRTADLSYEQSNNCLNLSAGLLTSDGVEPSPRGALNLANLHAGGILDAFPIDPIPPKPLPKPWGGRILLTSRAYVLTNGINGADSICTQEAGGLAAQALLVDETGCSGGPCRRASTLPWAGDGQIDWPLEPDRFYLRMDNSTAVGFTDALGLLAWPLYQGPSSDCTQLASGLSEDWTTTVGATCDSWHGGAPMTTGAGSACARDPRLLNSSSQLSLCAAVSFLCVVKGSPAAGP